MLKLLRIKEHLALVSAEYARFSSTNPSATGDLEILLQRQKPEDIRIRKSTNADYRSFKETIWVIGKDYMRFQIHYRMHVMMALL